MLKSYKRLKAMKNFFLDRINMMDRMLPAFHPPRSGLTNYPVNPVR